MRILRMESEQVVHTQTSVLRVREIRAIRAVED